MLAKPCLGVESGLEDVPPEHSPATVDVAHSDRPRSLPGKMAVGWEAPRTIYVELQCSDVLWDVEQSSNKVRRSRLRGGGRGRRSSGGVGLVFSGSKASGFCDRWNFGGASIKTSNTDHYKTSWLVS